MAFVRLHKFRAGSSQIPRDELRIGTTRQVNGRTISISLGREIVEQSGWEVIQVNENRQVIFLMLDEGVGDDAGFFLFTPADKNERDAYMFGSERKGSNAYVNAVLAQKLKHYVLNPEENVPPVKVEYSVEKDKSMLVAVPDFLRYNPLSYNEPPKEKVEPKPEPKRKEETRPRPTLVTVPEDKSGDEIHLNRQQRRKLASRVANALR